MALGAAVFLSSVAQRQFSHPGLSYTRADLDRMKLMVEAGVEPYLSTFNALCTSGYSSTGANVSDRGSKIYEGKFNGTVGVDGRRAHDLALLWHITGDESYARKAVEYLNANSHYTSTSARGTAPLDNGKVYLLIEAAELMRDYHGWSADDRQRFADMLVYPRYSSSENLYDTCASMDDEANGITFYWNIFNFDASRHGNQGLFAARAMMAMGVFLDNEKIYDRALRYINALPHRSDDLPYVAGPPVTSPNPDAGQSTDAMTVYSLRGRENSIEDYGYDEQLQHYIYANGQTQEACRDQGHALVGVQLLADIAELAWNQGDNLYSALDNRILTGLEWTFRYNLSALRSYPEQTEPWEPRGYTFDENEVSLDNGLFLRTRARSGRWESVDVSPDGRGDNLAQGGCREQALAHYSTRAGLPAESTKWLIRYRDYMIDTYGHESWGKPANWFYEWKGWGTLTKRLPEGMAGEAVTFSSGIKESGIPVVPASISFADYDYYPAEAGGAQNHTCHSASPAAPNTSWYRPDGGMHIEDSSLMVSDLSDGDSMTFTVATIEGGKYWICLHGQNIAESSISVAASGGTAAPFDGQFALVELPAGVSTLTFTVTASSPELKLSKFEISADKPSGLSATQLSPDNEFRGKEYDLKGRPLSGDVPAGTLVLTSSGKYIK